MKIGVPREVKDNEFRVALTPVGVNELVKRGHTVFLEAGAGVGSAISDDDYRSVGAKITSRPEDIWEAGDLILKVKEPIAEEFGFLRRDQALFTYLHMAAQPKCAEALLQAGTTAIAYETVQLPNGQLPLLYPMSEVAGCLAPQVAAFHLMVQHGGRGVLMGGIGGVPNAKVLVLGAGVSGSNAAGIAQGMGADVTIMDTDLDKLRAVNWRFHGSVKPLASSDLAIQREVSQADVVVGTVLVPGARAPKLVTNDMVATMKPGSVLIDIAIDQGGCFEDSRPTTHSEPTFEVHNSIFYCVGNMPGAVPCSSTQALTNATLSHVLQIADHGWREAMRNSPPLALGLNVHDGHVYNANVAAALDREALDLEELLA